MYELFNYVKNNRNDLVPLWPIIYNYKYIITYNAIES